MRARASATEHHDGKADAACIDRSHISLSRRRDFPLYRGLRQMAARVFDEIMRSAKRGDHAAEPFGCLSAVERLPDLASSRVPVISELSEHQHLGAERQYDIMYAGIPPRAGEMVDGMQHLDRVARRRR